MAEGTDVFREALDRVAGLVEVRVGERCNQAVRPIQAVRGDFRRGVAQVGGGVVDVRIERGGRGKRAGTPYEIHMIERLSTGAYGRICMATMCPVRLMPIGR